MTRHKHSPAVPGLFAVVVLMAMGCVKPEEFPVEPRIEFKEFVVFQDSASLVFTFTDGDGDVGLDPGDLEPPFDPGGAYHNNLFIEYYKRQNGEWQQVVFVLPLHYRIPRITPTGQNKTLKGEIATALKPWPLLPKPPGSPADTIRFSIRMVDRALHESNVVYSEDIILP